MGIGEAFWGVAGMAAWESTRETRKVGNIDKA
jgi:hypothetical protein